MPLPPSDSCSRGRHRALAYSPPQTVPLAPCRARRQRRRQRRWSGGRFGRGCFSLPRTFSLVQLLGGRTRLPTAIEERRQRHYAQHHREDPSHATPALIVPPEARRSILGGRSSV